MKFWFIFFLFSISIRSFICSTMLIYPFGFVVALVELLFLLIYDSNVMLLTTCTCKITYPIYVSISTFIFITSSHPFFHFFLFHSLASFRILSFSYFMTTPVVRNVNNACRICVMYNRVALNDWLFRITHIPVIFSSSSPFFCVCYGLCNWIRSDFLQFAFVAT